MLLTVIVFLDFMMLENLNVKSANITAIIVFPPPNVASVDLELVDQWIQKLNVDAKNNTMRFQDKLIVKNAM